MRAALHFAGRRGKRLGSFGRLRASLSQPHWRRSSRVTVRELHVLRAYFEREARKARFYPEVIPLRDLLFFFFHHCTVRMFELIN